MSRRSSSTTPKTPADTLLTINEFARTLRVQPQTVYRWIQKGLITTSLLPKVGSSQRYRIPRAVLEQILVTGVPAEQETSHDHPAQ